MKFTGLVFFFILLSACSTNSTVNIYSLPAGAAISEVGTNTSLGITPITNKHSLDSLNSRQDSSGCYLMNGLKAEWASGANAILSPLKLCDSSNGVYTVTLTRDDSYPDLKKDVELEKHLKNNPDLIGPVQFNGNHLIQILEIISQIM